MRGFRDFYPEEKRRQNYIFSIWKKVAERYGYSEIDGPILEPVELYQRSGEEIPEQMYTLTDKAGRKLALRPEITPTIARMVNQNLTLTKPIKWYSISRCLRYEAPQLGRLKSFFQFNLDVLGSKSMKADAEAIVTAIKIMQEFGLTKKDFYVRISNRRLIQSLFESIEIKKKNFKDVYRLVDKICKISKKDFELSLKDKGLTEKQIKDLLKILKITDLEKIKIKNEGLEELRSLFKYLKDYNVLDFCKLDLSIMRGFDYYTNTVFEVFDSSNEFRALAGGGRYDEFAKNCPGVGYGMGDVVLELFLKKKNKIPLFKKEVDFYVAPVTEKMVKKAISIAEKLRKKGVVEIDLVSRSLGKQLNYANSINAKKAVIVGEKDKKLVTVRDMESGKEKKIKI